MDGYQGRDFVSKQDYDDAITFNFWFGAGAGVVCTIVAELLFIWYKGWI